MSDFKSIGELFDSEPGLKKTRKLLEEGEVLYYFYIIFPQFINIAEPVKVEKKNLYLRVENAAWRSELKFREDELIKTINDYFSGERIKHLKFII
ncbi:MAG: DUF721 domain-containing protein [Ignavibacteriaceae bacterium]|nr:DUF721 domain-containing protein [Ignavibacteriaceae bacterium]